MNKFEFLYELSEKLSGIPNDDREKSLEYYGELIDDAIEDGVLEEDAIKSLGDIDDIVNDVFSSLSLPKLIKAKIKSKAKTPAWQIPLIIFGALIVVPVVICLLAGVFSIFATFWSLAIVFFAIDFAFAVCALAIIPTIVLWFIGVEWNYCIMTLSAILFLAGLSIPLFYLCKKYLKAMTYITKHSIILLKKLFVKKEAK